MSEPEDPVPLGRVYLRKDGPSPNERGYVDALIELIDQRYKTNNLAVYGRRPGRIERERIWATDHTIDWFGQPTDTEDYCSVGAFKRGLENWSGPRKRSEIKDVIEDLVICRADWDSIASEIELRGFRDVRYEEHASTRAEQKAALAGQSSSVDEPTSRGETARSSPSATVPFVRLSTKLNQLKRAIEAYGRKPETADAAVTNWLKHGELVLHISINDKVRPGAPPPVSSFWSTPQARRALITDAVPTKYLGELTSGVGMLIESEFDNLVRDEFPQIHLPNFGFGTLEAEPAPRAIELEKVRSDIYRHRAQYLGALSKFLVPKLAAYWEKTEDREIYQQFIQWCKKDHLETLERLPAARHVITQIARIREREIRKHRRNGG